MVRPFLVVMMLSWVTVAFAETPGAAAQTASQSLGTGTAAASRNESIVLKPLERAGLLRSTVGLRPIRLADGTMMVGVQSRFREFIVASVDPDGHVHVGCLHNERALRLVLEGRAQAARARFEER